MALTTCVDWRISREVNRSAFRGHIEDSFHGCNGGTGSNSLKAIACGIHPVVWQERTFFIDKIGIAYEGVADKVPTRMLGIAGIVAYGFGTTIMARFEDAWEVQLHAILVGIEVTIAFG